MLNIHIADKTPQYSVSLNHLSYQNLMSSEVDTIPILQVIRKDFTCDLHHSHIRIKKLGHLSTSQSLFKRLFTKSDFYEQGK